MREKKCAEPIEVHRLSPRGHQQGCDIVLFYDVPIRDDYKTPDAQFLLYLLMIGYVLTLQIPNTAAQVLEKQEHAEKNLSAANEAAHTASHLYITFLLLGTYIGVIIASTTDEQLLRVSPVTLPILDVKLPIRGFYIFVPWLFLLLHFNLLLHFHLLGRKLHAFDKSAAELEDKNRLAFRERLANVPFVHMLIGRQHDRFLRALLAFMVWITVAALPLSLLLWAQIAFLPFHDPDITWGQRIAVFLDAGLLLLFWGRIISSQGAIGWWLQRFDQIRTWAIWGWSWLWARIRKLVRRLPRTLVGLSPPPGPQRAKRRVIYTSRNHRCVGDLPSDCHSAG